MKKRFLCYLVILFALSTNGSAEADDSELCQAYAWDNSAAFVFPISDTDVWEWNKKTTQENALEYSWDVLVPANQPKYSFGIYKFKIPISAPPTSGSLQQLLNSSQITVGKISYRDNKSVHSLEKDLKVIALVQDGGIVVYINDVKTYTDILGEKPKEAKLIIRHPLPGYSLKCIAQIKYE